LLEYALKIAFTTVSLQPKMHQISLGVVLCPDPLGGGGPSTPPDHLAGLWEGKGGKGRREGKGEGNSYPSSSILL